ncbi:ParB/RepB/Spo0J family partition protein [uncultured Roseobacter sp.]|uniref:ParB/RepB/Spo0J family partition protein n=1 Tax=uncultured Roseobacter sp. TaxID=114847 RepID=UPI0026109A16|nr:ParB/RepB/Spo0J family partition protein [uncultured Roseobacter sp.]
MNIQHITLENLTTTNINVRKTGAKDVDALVQSIRTIGLLQPLLVRPAGEAFEVVAGQRRYHALCQIAEDTEIDPVPCVVMSADDDVTAIEASLTENMARAPMDEVDEYKAFAKLVAQGKSVDDIAYSFGLTERMVQQRLALGNLLNPILTAYRKDQIQPATLRLLTMATKKQQKAWLDLFRSEEDHAPQGYRLKQWLFGGTEISTDNALFDLESYAGNIISDLFGEDSYFDDPEAFWALQNVAIAEAKATYLDADWDEVILLNVGEYFPSYEYVDTPKENGGKVYVHIAHDGEVTFYEGQLSRKEIKSRERAKAGETAQTTVRPEITKAMGNYLELHRHAAVRNDLLSHPNVALRLITAHMIAGSDLWDVKADPQKAAKSEITDSLATNTAQQAFEVEHHTVAELLGLDGALMRKHNDYNARPDIAEVLTKLMALEDTEVMRVLTCLMADSLAVGTGVVEILAQSFGTDMQAAWSIDETFFDLIRDKEALNGMVAEIAGDSAAREHVTATAKTQKAIIKACLDGTRIAKVENWTPRYMAVPQQGYTERSGFEEVAEAAEAEVAIAAE